MTKLPDSILRLVDSFKTLPGIGVKTAERLAYYVIEKQDQEFSKTFSQNLLDVMNNITTCNICFFYLEKDKDCSCKHTSDLSKICVVQQPKDVLSFYNTGYKGLFHVLGGVLSPLDQIGPDDLNIKELLIRVNQETEEIIIATDTSLEGDATSIYLADLLENIEYELKITRLARGIPIGGQFEYIDELTLARALDERVEI